MFLREYFLREGKLELIDQQVRSTASILMNSELVELKAIEIDRVESILNDELGESQIGKFFVIRNAKGELLYESPSVKSLPVETFAMQPQWIAIERNGQYIRILNLNLPSAADRTLQVGLVVGEDFIRSRFLEGNYVAFRVMIFALGLLVAWFLTSTLMRPISQLAVFVSQTATNPMYRMELPSLPEQLRRLLPKSPDSADEMHRLLRGFDALIARINREYRISRFWSFQMAHELKTPMALMEAQITEAGQNKEISAHVSKTLLTEIFAMSETITSFLTWAEVENSPSQQNRTFANRASAVALDLRSRLQTNFPDRMRVVVVEDFYVLANPQHLEQVVNNLVVNALTYSPEDKPVTVELRGNRLRVLDQGKGIEKAVVERMGEPFNKGDMSPAGLRRGSGLGLALVHSVCNMYGWKIAVDTASSGTAITIDFPEVSE